MKREEIRKRNIEKHFYEQYSSKKCERNHQLVGKYFSQYAVPPSKSSWKKHQKKYERIESIFMDSKPGFDGIVFFLLKVFFRVVDVGNIVGECFFIVQVQQTHHGIDEEKHKNDDNHYHEYYITEIIKSGSIFLHI